MEERKCRRTFGRIFRTGRFKGVGCRRRCAAGMSSACTGRYLSCYGASPAARLYRSAFSGCRQTGEITYEASAIISQSEALSAGREDYIKLDGSDYRLRFAPLISSGVQLGYFICVDTDGHLQSIPPEIWNTVEQVLAKQAFIEASRQDKPFETAEDILMHLFRRRIFLGTLFSSASLRYLSCGFSSHRFCADRSDRLSQRISRQTASER